MRSNGEGTVRASSAIFGQPVTLHLMVKVFVCNSCAHVRIPSRECFYFEKQVRQGLKLNEKLVVRFYKEDLDEIDGQMQVIQSSVK